MSMEEAIKDHAAALRELSAAIKEMYAGRAAALALPVEQEGTGDKVKEALATVAAASSAELVKAVEQKDKASNFGTDDEPAPADAVKAGKQKPEAQPIKQDADLEQAVSKVEDDTLAAPLEYTKDVRPVLLQLSKAKGKDELLALLKKYGAKNGEAIKADDFAKIVADANALIGG